MAPSPGAIMLLLKTREGLKVRPWCSKAAQLAALLLMSGLFVAACDDFCAAGDIKSGRTKALMCQACHGLDGLSKVPDAPNIAGQTEPYLVAQLQAFKSGARKSESMSLVVQPLSDTDIDDLAAYFSAIEINVVKIPGQ